MRFAFCVHGCIPLPKEANNNNVNRRCALRLFYKRRLYKKSRCRNIVVTPSVTPIVVTPSAMFLLCVMLVFNVLGQKI